MKTMRFATLVLVFALAGCTATEPTPQWVPGPGTHPPSDVEKQPATPAAETPGVVEPEPGPAAPVAAAEPPAAAAAALATDIHWVRNSAEYRAAFLQTYTLATRRIEELAAGLEPGGWAVALDSDETVLSNAEFQKEIAGQWNQKDWDAWVVRRAGIVLPGVKTFLERVRELGGKIVIVTNRTVEECGATADNFLNQELFFDAMLCKDGDGEKEPRWDAVEAGTTAAGLPPLKIVMWVGDNIQDFPNLDQRLRLEPEAAFQEFGTRFFILPNPMYGSFTRNPRE